MPPQFRSSCLSLSWVASVAVAVAIAVITTIVRHHGGQAPHKGKPHVNQPCAQCRVQAGLLFIASPRRGVAKHKLPPGRQAVGYDPAKAFLGLPHTLRGVSPFLFRRRVPWRT
ncbi:MAG: hypothetical protein ACK559_18335, partial [bacterium]